MQNIVYSFDPSEQGRARTRRSVTKFAPVLFPPTDAALAGSTRAATRKPTPRWPPSWPPRAR